jgi:hypothetical protein
MDKILSHKKITTPYKKKKILTEKQAKKEPIGSFYHPTKKTIRTGVCPIKFDLKKGYKRKSYTKSDGEKVPSTYVKPICIKDKGLPGKLLDEYKPFILSPKNGLKPYGYSTSVSSKKRYESLMKAIKELSYTSVIRRLINLRTLTKTSNKEHSKIYDEDIQKLRLWREKNPNLYKKS